MDIVIIEIDLGKKLLQLGGYGRSKAVTPRAAHGESRVVWQRRRWPALR